MMHIIKDRCQGAGIGFRVSGVRKDRYQVSGVRKHLILDRGFWIGDLKSLESIQNPNSKISPLHHPSTPISSKFQNGQRGYKYKKKQKRDCYIY
jgi:hypothetical protein